MSNRTMTALFLSIALTASIGTSQVEPATTGDKATIQSVKPSETTVKGTVEDVKRLTNTSWAPTHLILKSDEGTFDVHVGPAAYISARQFSFAKGETIEVVGWRSKVRGQDALLARQITKAGTVLKLRNEQGQPMWPRPEQKHSHAHDSRTSDNSRDSQAHDARIHPK